MLNAMRKGADSIVLKVMFVAIVLVFVFWGIGAKSSRFGSGKMEAAARVNDAIINNHDFDLAYRRMASSYQRTGAQPPPAEMLRKQAISELIDVELLNQEAARLGLSVDEAELRDAIAAMPELQRDGHFDKDYYIMVLQQNGLKPSDFEEMQRRQMLVGKVEQVVRSGVHVSDQEIKERFDFENERLNLRFIRVPAASYLDQVTVSDEDVQKYYADNQEKYREPERIRIKLIEFKPENFTEQVTPSDSDVQAYYDAHSEDYHRHEEVHARHILFKVAPDASPDDKAAARKKAEDVLAKAKGGADFGELAKQFSQDTTASSGGDLGSFGHGVMTPAFETAAFALQPGQISDIVETPFGFHIIKVEEKTPDHVEKLEDVRPKIVAAVKTQQARQLALKKVEDAHEQLLDGKDFAQVAADAGLSVQTPQPFGRGEAIPGLGPRPELAKEALGTDAGEVGEIVTEPSGYSLFAVEERIPSAIPDLTAVRSKVENDVRRQHASAAAKKRAEELLAQLKTQPDIDAVAKREQIHVEESNQVGRIGSYIPSIGSLDELKAAAFRLTPEAPVAPAVYEINGDSVVAVLATKIPADESRLESEKPAYRQRLQQRAEANAVQHFLEQLKSNAQIQVGQSVEGASNAS